jgi:hypothetical protein
MGYGINNTLQRIQETEVSYVLVIFHGRLMDELANEVIDDHHRIQFLLDQFRGFAAEKGWGLTSQGRALMSFYLIESDLSGKGLAR